MPWDPVKKVLGRESKFLISARKTGFGFSRAFVEKVIPSGTRRVVLLLDEDVPGRVGFRFLEDGGEDSYALVPDGKSGGRFIQCKGFWSGSRIRRPADPIRLEPIQDETRTWYVDIPI